jgi:hypothetical protein
MTVSVGLDTDLKNVQEHLRTGQKWIRAKSKGETFEARALPLSTILDNSMAPREIDFFSLDVEGAELSVLQGIDFEKYTFRYILVESRTPDLISDYLATFGYQLKEQLSGHDYLFSSSAGHE